jgi:antitoxin PrlF
VERVTTLTSKGQVTIPQEIRDELSLKPHDKLRISMENGHVALRKAYPSLDEVAGSLPSLASLRLNMTVERVIDLANEERAKELIEKTKNR